MEERERKSVCGHHHEHEHHRDRGHDHDHGCGACCGCCDHGHGDEEGGAGTWIRIGIAAALFIAGLLTRSLPTVSLILFALSTLVSAGPVFVGAIRELRHTLFGEQTLLMIAVLAAFAIGEGLEGAAVAVLFAIGEELEEYAARRSYNAIRTLSDLRPDTAWKRDENGELQEVPAESVEAGDLLELLPHRRIAVDCEVVSGEGTVDLSALTGESAPVSAVPGTALLSGGMNGNETLTVRALRPATESAAARILSLVTDASARKGSAEKFITRFARIYTPAVTGAAVLLAVVPSLFGWLPWTESIHRALTFLVASCPCALVISIPLGFTAGMGAASKRGVLIKGGRFLRGAGQAAGSGAGQDRHADHRPLGGAGAVYGGGRIAAGGAVAGLCARKGFGASAGGRHCGLRRGGGRGARGGAGLPGDSGARCGGGSRWTSGTLRRSPDVCGGAGRARHAAGR